MNVRGLVTAAGAITVGTGFTVAHVAASGTYTITYITPFDAEPVVQATVGSTGGVIGIKLTAHSASGCTVLTYNSSTGASVDAEFFLSVDG